jgi:hypothetical protein
MPPKKKKKEKPEKTKKKEEQQSQKAEVKEVKEEVPEAPSPGPLMVLGKTSSLWKSVGKTYRRDRKERILTELDPDSWGNDNTAKATYKTRLIPADMNYDTPVWQVSYNHQMSISMSATEHPDIIEEQRKKSEKKYGARSQKNIVVQDPFAVMGMNEYERFVIINIITTINIINIITSPLLLLGSRATMIINTKMVLKHRTHRNQLSRFIKRITPCPNTTTPMMIVPTKTGLGLGKELELRRVRKGVKS